MKVLIALYHPFVLWNAPLWLAGRLHQDFPSHEFIQLSSYEGISDAIRDAEVAIAWSIRSEQFASAKALKWIHSPAAAVHQLLFPELAASGVTVTNARQIHGPVVAEHALALVFALAKRLPLAMQLQHKSIWGQQIIWDEKPTTREISGGCAVVVGIGNIGREFARLARALGMRVLAVREHPQDGAEGADGVFGRDGLHLAFPQADYVVLAAPLTPGTRHIINSETLKLLKSHCYIINVGRGPLIDDAALVAALSEKRIAGAALDVFPEEPLPPASPYWHMENVLITPHTAAVTEKLWARHYELISENLRRYLSGQPLLSVVDKQRGY
jgi:phosphoglycerate dehydrogenase-like enzyme